MPEYGPFLKDFRGELPCRYRGVHSDNAATLIGFARSGDNAVWKAMIQLRGMILSVPLYSIDFPAWMRD